MRSHSTLVRKAKKLSRKKRKRGKMLKEVEIIPQRAAEATDTTTSSLAAESPAAAKLAANPELQAYVQERLEGAVTAADGTNCTS